MKLSETCIERPVLSWVFTLVLILMGFVGLFRLPVQKYPSIENVFLTIETQMPGVGPDIVESQITRHIEDSIAGIEGIETISSVSSSEESKVYIEFRPGRSMEDALNDVRDRLARVKEKLPQPNLRTEPMILRSRSDERPIMSLALTSNQMDSSELYDYAENEIKKDLESIAGIARIDVSGASSYVMKVDVDPILMAGHKINISDVRDAISSQNFEAPAGRIESKNKQYNVTTVADLNKPRDFEEVIVSTDKGRIIKIKDIGKVSLDADDKRTRMAFNGKTGVRIAVTKQSNANPLQIAEDIKSKLLLISKRLPKDAQIQIANDTTTYISKSINSVYLSIIEASILVILVVFLFLKSAKASLIPLVTIPVSIIGVAFLMYILGYTINIFTLFALVLAVGLVVDDAIVVLENIHRHIHDGYSPYEASIKGIREIGFSVVAMTLTLVAVYLPIPLGSGKIAKFFTEFAITLAGSVLLSGFIALTLSPMMCSKLLKPNNSNKTKQNGRWEKFSNAVSIDVFLERLENSYHRTLKHALDEKKSVITFSIIVFLSGIWVFSSLRSEYFPEEDTRSFGIEAHAPPSATLEYTEKHLKHIDSILSTYPEIERRISSIINPNVDISVELTEDDSSIIKSIGRMFTGQGRSTQEIIEELTARFKNITGLEPRIQTGGAGGSDSNLVSFVVRGNKETYALSGSVKELTNALLSSGMIRGVRARSSVDNEDYILTLNRDKIANIQKTPREISDFIRYLLKGEKTGKFKKDNKQYDVNVQVFSEYKSSPDDILKFYIRGGTPKDPNLIPLSELISIDSRTSPPEIQRHNRTKAESVQAVLKKGYTVGDAITKIRQIADETLQEGVYLDFTGETQRFITESKSMQLVFMLSLCFIYLVLAAQFESWRDPFIIFISVPLSLVGGVYALNYLERGTLNMFSFIGFITLIGLITKHGILIVDFANKIRKSSNESAKIAVLKASQMRLRPILMTTLAMVLGAVPLMFGGAGNENRRQLGAVIIGGMSLGTIFTLYIVPLVYTLISSNKVKKKIFSS
ncbi:MAG: multidrug transporter AcrB [Candidatus Puniceispirillum sp.]|nr:multidrug transporter AcrB [Candidatus Pelagibacter sp.]MBA4283434.1 multidrug transporter AcrB [Candidatus Puniceispirillum sp.]